MLLASGVPNPANEPPCWTSVGVPVGAVVPVNVGVRVEAFVGVLACASAPPCWSGVPVAVSVDIGPGGSAGVDPAGAQADNMKNTAHILKSLTKFLVIFTSIIYTYVPSAWVWIFAAVI